MMILDHLANQLQLSWTRHRPWKAQIAQTRLVLPYHAKNQQQQEFELTLLKPQLLMNVSGPSVANAGIVTWTHFHFGTKWCANNDSNSKQFATCQFRVQVYMCFKTICREIWEKYP